MLELVLKLIDRCIDLLKRKEESNRRLFDDFVAPAFSDFEALHNDYIERFRKYRETIMTSDEPFHSGHPIFNQIDVDNLFSASYRAKVWELEGFVDHPVFGSFIQAIIRYIRFDKTWKPRPTKRRYAASALTQTIARATRHKIETKVKAASKDQSRRKEAVEVLDKTIGTIQESYSLVVQEYSLLKSKLLKTK